MKRKSGFSLIELLVVIGIMALLAALVIPGLFTMMSSSADDQTYEMFAAQLNIARAIALTENTYTVVHCQIAQESYIKKRPEAEDTCFLALLIFDKVDGNGDGTLSGHFSLPRLHSKAAIKNKYYSLEPIALPKGWALGGICKTFVSEKVYSRMAGLYLHRFTSFTVIFNPSGQVVISIPGREKGVPMGTNPSLFGSSGLWKWGENPYYGEKAGVTAVTVLDYGKLNSMLKPDGETIDDTDRTAWLNKNAQFLSINVYTGQLFPRTTPAPPTP